MLANRSLILRRKCLAQLLKFEPNMEVVSAQCENLAAGDVVRVRKPRLDEQQFLIRFLKLKSIAQTLPYGSAVAAGVYLYLHRAEDCVVPA